MSLTMHAPTAGLWLDPQRWERGPGTFAVVIGVSAYPALGCGARDALGAAFSPLAVSALTARRFFTWLRAGYSYSAAPLTACWLLLAPSPAELTMAPDLATLGAPATFAGCRQALQACYAQIAQLTPEAQRASRVMFFFSGHGIAPAAGRQLLLPSDYLSGVGGRDDTIDVENLRHGFGCLELGQQLLFIDACRNSTPQIHQHDLVGQRILPQDHPVALRNAQLAPAYYACALGAQAWQPSYTGAGLSLFGQALIAGLEGAAAQPGSGALPAGVSVFSLQDYLSRRVAALLAGGPHATLHPVRLEGSSGADMLISASDTSGSAAPLAPAPATPPAERALLAELNAILVEFPALDDIQSTRALFAQSPRLARHLNHLPIGAGNRADRANRLGAYFVYDSHGGLPLLRALLGMLADATPADDLRERIAALSLTLG